MTGTGSSLIVRVRAGARLAMIVAASVPLGLQAGSIETPSFPNRPIRLIVPFSAGGGTDLLARLVAQPHSEALGQAVVVDNRGGGGGLLGIELAARAPSDGHTLLFVAGSFAIQPSLERKASYDPLKDFASIALVATIPYVIVSSPSSSARTLTELIGLARANPGRLNFGSGGSGTSGHLAAELFCTSAGISLVHVPYKGSVPAMNDLISGQIQLLFIGTAASASHINAGRVRGLALVAPVRSPVIADVPTIAEAGMPHFDVTTWYGMVGPTGTPTAIVRRLNLEVSAIIRSQEARGRLSALGAEPAVMTPAEFADFIGREVDRWRAVIRRAALRAH